MKHTRAVSIVAMTMTIFSMQIVHGAGFDANRLFFGVGMSENDHSYTHNGTGYQAFGGYEFGEVARNLKLDVEAGYMDTGDMEFESAAGQKTRAKGPWATGVGRYLINPQFEVHARAGFDFGDDDGFMYGAGVGYVLGPQAKVRLELVERDDVSSLQFNLVFNP